MRMGRIRPQMREMADRIRIYHGTITDLSRMEGLHGFYFMRKRGF
jgi:hypothetical protein